MNKRPEFVEKAVSRAFSPPNAGRAARRQVFVLMGTALIVAAALNAEGWLAWLLWAWTAWRSLVFGMLLAIGPMVADAMTERLSALPEPWRRHLKGGAA